MSEAFIPPDQMTVKYIQIDLNRKVSKKSKEARSRKKLEGKGRTKQRLTGGYKSTTECTCVCAFVMRGAERPGRKGRCR